MVDAYLVLGVSRGASRREIVRAYRRLARRYHPDVSGDEQGLERFLAVQEAYEVLSDARARAVHDARLPRVEPDADTRRAAAARLRQRLLSEIETFPPAERGRARRSRSSAVSARPAPSGRKSIAAAVLGGMALFSVPPAALLVAARESPLGPALLLTASLILSLAGRSLADSDARRLWRWTTARANLGMTPRHIAAESHRARRRVELAAKTASVSLRAVPAAALLVTVFLIRGR
jgi:curved DNA-binding protein CbpA